MYVCKPKFPTWPNRRTFNLQFQGRFQQCMAIGTNKRCEGEHELVTKVDGTETAQINEGAAVSSLASEERSSVHRSTRNIRRIQEIELLD